MKSSKSFN